MKIEMFEVGDKVVPPAAVIRMDRSSYAVIRFIGSKIVVLETELGTEFTVYRDLAGFELWRSYDDLKRDNERLRRLGFDLYTSIRDAAWTQIDLRTGDESPNLSRPTPHMRSASENWRIEVEENV